MTTTYLHTSVYDPTSDLQQSDQITVPADVWSMFDRDHTGAGPVFVTVKDYLTEIPLLGRIRPAVPEDGLAMDTMRLPSWIWLGLGVPLEDAWIELTVATPYLVEKVVLRPNRHAELVSLSDPAATLSAQIMGSGSGGWGSLTVGMDLDLPCGVFRVEELTDVEGVEIQSGCILDADIRLDFLPAWDYEPPVRFPAPTPPPEPVPVLAPMVPFTEHKHKHKHNQQSADSCRSQEPVIASVGECERCWLKTDADVLAMFRSVLSAARRALRVQYASDLHLEFLSDKPVFPALLKPVAPVLVLAGDIGQPQRRSYRDLLHHCSRNWDDVVIVAGNHELYGGHVTQRLELCRAMALEFGNVHFLERDRVVCHGVTFFGCTLWTQDSTPRLNDYRRIEAENGSMLTVADTNRWHGRDKEWLRLALANTEGPTVVVTHHLPSFRLIAPEFEGSPLNSGFASDCDALIAPPVSVWIAGHTHRAMRVRFENGVVAAVNPRGYPDELGDVTGHSREAVVEVPLGPTGPSGEGAATDDGFLDRMAAAHANSALSGFTTVDAQIVEDDVVFV